MSDANESEKAENAEKPASPDLEASTDGEEPKRPQDELAAAFAHLKSAADLFAKKIDPAVRRAADEAEKALEKVASETERAATEIGTAAKPLAARVGGELGKFAEGLRKAVSNLEHAGDEPADAKKKDPPDPDDPNATSV